MNAKSKAKNTIQAYGVGLGVMALAAATTSAQAGSREQALRIYGRVAGVPPSDAELSAMISAIDTGNFKDAVKVATSSFHFYNTNLVRWAHQMSNRDETTRPDTTNGVQEGELNPLNDYVATMVGMVRDDVPFDQVLYGDIVYVGAPGAATTAYAFAGNAHYKEIGDKLSTAAGGLDLSKTTTLVQSTQTALRGGFPDVAGVMTTRQAATQFYQAGTNRRMYRYLLKEFLCMDPAALMDTSASDYRVRRDVERTPTGNSQVYLTSCKGCHSGMDGFAGAFAYFNYTGNNNGALTYTAGTVAGKINAVNNFSPGYNVTDDSWVNNWITGPNAKILGWRGEYKSGNGVKSLGRAFAATEQFSRCMAQRAFELGCVRSPASSDTKDISELAKTFEKNGYKMRDLIENAAILPQCRGN